MICLLLFYAASLVAKIRRRARNTLATLLPGLNPITTHVGVTTGARSLCRILYVKCTASEKDASPLQTPYVMCDHITATMNYFGIHETTALVVDIAMSGWLTSTRADSLTLENKAVCLSGYHMPEGVS
jgi:hypothetical protein